MITPAPSRATLEDTPDGLRVTIPAARKPVFASLLVIWLAFAVTFTRDLFAHVVTPADLAFALCVAAILLFLRLCGEFGPEVQAAYAKIGRAHV